MLDLESLRLACLAAPDDVTLRLVYADCLDEQGTDRDAARAEWIRTFHAKNRPPGKTEDFRQPGELAWMKGNAARLWPALVGRARGRDRVTPRPGESLVQARFGTKSVRLRIPYVTGGKYRANWVYVKCHRGVTDRVLIPLCSFVHLAPYMATDEPGVELEFLKYVHVIRRGDRGDVRVDHELLVRSGLRSVSERMTGEWQSWRGDGRGGAIRAIVAAITDWARAKARELQR